VFLGADPVPYLRGVPDPYERASPHHDWKVTFSGAEMRRLLDGLYAGRLLEVEVLETGVSGRIVKARIEGSRRSTTVDGPTLQTRLGLRSTWASFRRVVPRSRSRARNPLRDWPCGLRRASGACSGIPWRVSPLPPGP
jgi:peptidoglycan hydrolase-like amidase